MQRETQATVQVANLALRILQSHPIESFGEDSIVAQTVRMYYDVVLRRCLSAYSWSFSQKQAELEQLPKELFPQWKFVYKLPPDLVRLIWLRSGVGEQLGRWDVRDYEIISGNLICTNAPSPLYARYQYEAPVAHYPHHFIEFFVASLAEELAAVFGRNLNTQASWAQGGRRGYQNRTVTKGIRANWGNK
jgi:hypothetical protein